ncbi:hypothetical protein [Streptomyces sp. enrichment culture]|uniref:hypothetical protein n=1 Tax=Streptomyces sp. enrichment culture TaxID=1795815 RepID=UPI003F5652E2
MGYRELADLTRYHPTTLQRAADGKRVSSWEVVEEFTRGCGLATLKVRTLWLAARSERFGRRGPRDVPGVEQVYNYSDLGAFLADLRERKGSPPYRLMERRAELTREQFGGLPHSTAQRIATRKTRPSLSQCKPS